MSEDTEKPAIGVAWTGASGLVYGVRLVDVLLNAGRDVNLVVSSAVEQTAPVEMNHPVEGLMERLRTLGPGELRVFGRTEFTSPLASGSATGGPLVIIPCSMGTVGRIVMDGPAEKIQDNPDIKEFYLGLGEFGARKSYKDVKHYKRRKRWL